MPSRAGRGLSPAGSGDVAVSAEVIADVARRQLGHDSLRPGQPEAVTSLLEGRDTLVVMPTGSGKSAVYQIAGALLEGPTVVVSPLIALQKDQVSALGEADVGAAVAANSAMSASDRRDVLDRLDEGVVEFVFVAPEQLANQHTRAALRRARPGLFVVDEAHCISEWGHDFRPEYLRLGAAADELGRPPILALTATASPVVRDEIVDRLGLQDPAVLVRGFDRPSLWLEVRHCRTEREKADALLASMARVDLPGIVYVATRRQTAEMAELLRSEAGLRAAAYHGGMQPRERHTAQEQFMAGEVDVIVATTAFGMGIDKADVRFVIHYDVPESVDAYYQEAGRAGRDGFPALALLLWRPEDLGLRKFFANNIHLDPDEVVRVATVLRAAVNPVPIVDLQTTLRLSETRLGQILARLEEVGAVEVGTTDVVARPDGPSPEEAAAAAVDAQHDRTQMDGSRLTMMRGYAETRGCRRRYILTYFGEPAADECFTCDRCVAAAADAVDLRPQEEGGRADGGHVLAEQQRVRHPKWGEGLVLRRDGDQLTVLFDEVGYKTLSVELVTDRGLLEPL